MTTAETDVLRVLASRLDSLPDWARPLLVPWVEPLTSVRTEQLLLSVFRKVLIEGGWVDVSEYGNGSGKFILLDTGHVDITDEQYEAVAQFTREQR